MAEGKKEEASKGTQCSTSGREKAVDNNTEE